jgi:hypothetical protein
MGCGRRGRAAPGLIVSSWALLLAGAGPAGAASRTPPVGAPAPPRTAPAVRGDFLDEGFETAVPPAGWTLTGNPSVTGVHRWHRTTAAAYVHADSAAALIEWQSPRTQDERLETPLLDLTGASPTGLRLSFWWYTDPFWAAYGDLLVQLSTDGANWTTAWRAQDLGESGWAWRNTLLDLGAYAGGMLTVRFRYFGRDGANVSLDEVRVGYLSAAAPPVNDDCAGAAGDPQYVLSQTGPFALAGDNTYAASDYPLAMPGSCTGYTHSGRDVVWVMDVPAQHELTATMTTAGHWDDMLFLVSDCSNPAGTCLAGANALPDGSTVQWTNPSGGTARVYLIASGYAQAAGPFTLTGSILPGTAVTAQSWGRIKARYR